MVLRTFANRVGSGRVTGQNSDPILSPADATAATATEDDDDDDGDEFIT